MRRALELARKGEGRTSPNPMVGCVIESAEGQVVGEGYHPAAGAPHAEVYALRGAGEEAEGGTAYVTLEPCSHIGRTASCARALRAAKVARWVPLASLHPGEGRERERRESLGRRAVVGCRDPSPKVAGRGLSLLEEAGVEVALGCEEASCVRLNEGSV